MIPYACLCIVIGYCFGCILTANIVEKRLRGVKANDIGSGNPGMANVMREEGKKAGFIVLAGDILKTVIAIAICMILFGKVIGNDMALLFAGAGAVVGHNYPITNKFKGGMGVTVSISWIILLMPVAGIICSLIGAGITYYTGYLAIGGVLIPLLAAICAFVLKGFIPGIFMVFCSLMMFWKFRDDLKDLFKGDGIQYFRNRNKNKSPDAENDKKPQ